MLVYKYVKFRYTQVVMCEYFTGYSIFPLSVKHNNKIK